MPSATKRKLAAQLRGLVGKAIEDYAMISEGDRVMVCLSGGKDSYTLLDMLMSLQRAAPVNFSLIAVNLDQKQPDFPAHVLPDYLRALGVDFHIIEQDTYSVVKRLIPEGRTMCSLCSRMRRGALYRYAAENGITRIALGHHRDDIVETLFLNLFHGGKLKAMAPKLRSDDGRHIVIRPLAYVAERDIERYAAVRDFPIIPCNLCGSQENLQRVAIKKMLAEWEASHPGPHRVAAYRAAQCRAGAPGGHRPVRLRRPASRATDRYVKPPIPNSYWVEPGRLLAGEHPAGNDLAATRKRIAALLEAGVRSFIDLTEPGEMESYTSLLPADVALRILRIAGSFRTGDCAADARGADGPVARPGQPARRVCALPRRHRPHGNDGGLLPARTGRARPMRRWHELNRLWQQNARSAAWPEVPETAEQEQFVLRLATATRSTAGARRARHRRTHLRPTRMRRSRGCLVGLAVGRYRRPADCIRARSVPAAGPTTRR